MPTTHVINIDLAQVFEAPDRKKLITILGWGDEVELINQTAQHVEIKLKRFVKQPDGSFKAQMVSGFIAPNKTSGIKASEVVIAKDQNKVLRVSFVDVQQGDGAVIESPQGQVVLVDGGDNQLFARYLAARYSGTSDTAPKEIACILVTHGDADHFEGLTKIFQSETDKNLPDHKRLFLRPLRVFHNGLVKRPSTRAGKKVKDEELLGPTHELANGTLLLTGLEDDLLSVDTAEMNQPFQAWKKALKEYATRSTGMLIRRLEKGDDQAFNFLSPEKISVEVLGPIVTKAEGVKGLKFLGDPPKGPRIGHDAHGLEEDEFKGRSASHTINGHSVVLRLSYGEFRFLFAGDLNDQAERTLTRAHKAGTLDLTAEVLKVPHHGSGDFSAAFLAAVAPIISVVSSGDESQRKEFIHPRATLVGALGKNSRVSEPLIFVTELAAFFQVEGFVDAKLLDKKNQQKKFFAFSRAAFGLVMVRTDGERLLVFTHSGQADLKEAYAYRLSASGEPSPTTVRKA